MDNWTKAEAIAEVALTADNPDVLTGRIARLLDQIDVLRLALALACGEWELGGAKLAQDDLTSEICTSAAQDELRHGRRPEWLDTEVGDAQAD